MKAKQLLRRAFRDYKWLIELHVFTHSCGIAFTRQWNDLSIMLAVPFLFQLFVVRKNFKHELDRDLSLRVFDGGIWWHIWTPAMEWSRKTPRWRDGNFKPADFLLGRRHYSDVTLDEHKNVNIAMREATYTADVRLYLATWKRPRWPFSEQVYRADIELEKGIPIPGKGENSWDLDDNALFGTTCPAKTLGEAIEAIRESAYRSRERYGGSRNWTPEAQS